MLLPRFGWCLCFVLASAFSAPLRAQSSGDTAAAVADRRAVIVLIGAAGRDSELSALLTELLELRGVRAVVSAAQRFDGAQLLEKATLSDSVDVFIVPTAGDGVRLYFRAPDGERFLLRSVPLRGGFDDIGREQIGQVVETAVAALLQPGAGLTLEQTRRALNAESPAAVAAATTASNATPPRAAPVAAPTARAEPSRATTLEGWFALRYGVMALDPELGVAHGPGLELGLAAVRGLLLRARLSAERDFTQTLESSLVAAELSRLRWSIAADAGLPFGDRSLGQRLLISLGLGQDRVRVTPRAKTASNVAPAPAFLDVAPSAHTELRYEVGGESVRLALAAGIDVALARTHYDVAHRSARQKLLEPWPVRPTASLALAFCPRWATF